MTTKDALIYSLTVSKTIVGMFLSDLDDADLQVRPVSGANNIAWQIGHLIATETALGGQLGIAYPALPPILQPLMKGSSSQTHSDGGNLSRAQYLQLFTDVRNATIAGLPTVPDAVLDEKTEGTIGQLAPTKGNLIALIANHTMMHAGQFSVVRRLLNKPVMF